ncbi:MAG TPA: response regulator [Aggregatilineaceae bacterium]|nr:response regulator [Aggregatilineaceae bacterium]
MITCRVMRRWMGTGSLYRFVAVNAARPRYSQPLQEDDLAEFTAGQPILVTDDSPEMVTMYRLGIQRFGTMHAIGTTSAFEALRWCEELPVSLIVSDLMKPDMHGLELLERVRANPKTQHLPFLVVSACLNDDYRVEARRLGVDQCMEKPVARDEFMETVRHLLMASYRKVIAS